MAFCANCGRKIDGGTKFCPDCGNPVQTEQTVSEPAPQKMAITDPHRLTAITVSLIDGRSQHVEGYAQWLSEDIEAMKPDEIQFMLTRIRDTSKRVNALADKANELGIRKKKMEEDYDTAIKYKNYGWVIGVPLVLLILDILLLNSDSGFLNFLGGVGAFVVGFFFIFMICTLISGGKWRKNAIKDYTENHAAIQREVDRCVDAWYADYQNNNHMHVSAYKALPNYYWNIDALNFMISCVQNHRATTLKEAINQYEVYKHNQALRDQVGAQIVAINRAADASDRAASASSRAADSAAAAARAANNPYRK